MRTLWLKKNEDRRLRAGHLWVFSNEVDTHKSPLTDFTPGEEATLCDFRGAPLGSVCVTPGSLICARIHARKPHIPLDKDLLLSRLNAALSLRQKLFAEPFYRLCHGEGDFLPGLVIDRYGEHCTLQLTTAAMESRRDLIVDCLDSLLHPASLLCDNDLAARRLEGLEGVNWSRGPLPEVLDVPENGCRFLAPCATGQKTGWFYDQRPNRRELARWAPQARVLDVFSYVGGFGATAAAAGASSVCFVDASAHALELARRNAARNAPALADSQIETLCGDAFDILNSLHEAGRSFDVISVDPPAFIKRRKDAAQGLAAYRRINALALRLLSPGGILASSSCSHHLPTDALRQCVAQAAAHSKRHARLLHAGTQGPDHPIQASMPETAYLKCLVAQID